MSVSSKMATKTKTNTTLGFTSQLDLLIKLTPIPKYLFLIITGRAIIIFYYMANPVLGKYLCSDWFFLGQDFAVRTISMETVQSMYFLFWSKAGKFNICNQYSEKKVWQLSFFTLKLPAEAKKIEIFPKFQRWMKKTNIF